MEKYKLKTKKNQTVYFIELNIVNGENMSNLNKEGLFVKEYKIVHQSKHRIALSDDWITVLDRQKLGQKKESYNNFLNDINVTIKTNETYFPNGVFCRCYTIDNPEKVIKKLKQQMIIEIEKKYGFLRNLDVERKIYDMEITKL